MTNGEPIVVGDEADSTLQATIWAILCETHGYKATVERSDPTASAVVMKLLQQCPTEVWILDNLEELKAVQQYRNYVKGF